MRKIAPQDAQSGLAETLGRYRTALIGVIVLSALINMLMLTGPLFMLQVYDRVLPSRNIPTLVGLAVLAAALFSFQGILDAIRGRVLHRIGGSISEDLVGRAYNAVLRLPLVSRGGGDGLQPVRGLDKIQQFLASPGPGALFDLPWMPFYVAICFLFHPYIGIAAAVGAAILITLTLIAEFVTRAPTRSAVELGAKRSALLESSRRNAAVMHGFALLGQVFSPSKGHAFRPKFSQKLRLNWRQLYVFLF